MKLILTKDVPSLGTKGEIVDVASGYARNYLLPKSYAVIATRGALQQAEGMRKAHEDAIRRAREEADNMAQALIGTRVVVAARAGDEGKLFGSIGSADVAQAIAKFTGMDIDRKIVALKEPIKDIGLHEVTLSPHPEVSFAVTLDVIPA